MKQQNKLYNTHTLTITDDLVNQFAEITGDDNPIHLDEEFAKNTLFKARISHGILVSSTISAALAKLPGTIIYLNQNLNFNKPVFIGETVTAIVEEKEQKDENVFILNTIVKREKDDETVVEGEAKIMKR